MTGENFKRFHASKINEKREKRERLEEKRSKLWDEFCKWCEENPSGGTPPIDYEYELKQIAFYLENLDY